jgi:demethylmenaquinone methyltransferase/2-methoxy-6-polyprenyl-1,4-benzoquinol methylase
MFDRIVPRYDLMNRIMTGGRDEAWRRRVAKLAIAAAPEGTRARVLDVATGTGDLAFAIAKLGAEVTGIDFSEEMIAAARRKAGNAASPVTFSVGDAMDLPFPDASFDACTVSFGLRNMPDYDAAMASMTRVLKPGGRFICLEMTPLHRPVVGPIFKVYFERVMPLVGGLLSGAPSAYRYLPKSVEAFPTAHDLAERMRQIGLTNVSYTLLGFGTVAIHVGTRPAAGQTGGQ